MLALDAGKEWSRPLRGSPRDVSFVSFLLYASASTIVDLAGVRLGITASPAGGNLQLMYDDSTTGTLQWKSLNFHVGTGNYVGKTFAALPTLTIRLDPATNTWDLYSGSRLLADNLPMIAAKKDQRQFLLRAGSEGAWLRGLVMADENPLYEDANANGIDDAFEKQKRGTLLAATTSVIERQLLAQEWKAAQRRKAPPALYVSRPAPDRIAASTSSPRWGLDGGGGPQRGHVDNRFKLVAKGGKPDGLRNRCSDYRQVPIELTPPERNAACGTAPASPGTDQSGEFSRRQG